MADIIYFCINLLIQGNAVHINNKNKRIILILKIHLRRNNQTQTCIKPLKLTEITHRHEVDEKNVRIERCFVLFEPQTFSLELLTDVRGKIMVR